MESLQDIYIKHVQKDFQQWPVWEPNTLIEIGAVGRFHGFVFKAPRHLSGFGLRPEVGPASTWSPLLYTSDAKAKVGFKANTTLSEMVSPVVNGDARALIEVTSRPGVVLHAKRHRDLKLTNLDAVLSSIIELIMAGKWEPHRCVVTNVKEAQDLSAIVFAEKGGRVEFEAAAGLALGSLDLAKSAGSLSVVGVSAHAHNYTMKRGTPMFQEPIRIRQKLWGVFGKCYLVDPSGEKFPVVFPPGDSPDGDSRLEAVSTVGTGGAIGVDAAASLPLGVDIRWEGTITRKGIKILSALANAELFERVDATVVQRDLLLYESALRGESTRTLRAHTRQPEAGPSSSEHSFVRTDLGSIRAWARNNGYAVNDRGRIPSVVLVAYDAANHALAQRSPGAAGDSGRHRAKVVTYSHTCDICGDAIPSSESINHTRRIIWDGDEYVVDVCSTHDAELAAILGKLTLFFEAGLPELGRQARQRATRSTAPRRSVSGRQTANSGVSGGRPKRGDLGAIRAWAREQGHLVSDRGRIPAGILADYDAAESPPVSTPPHEATARRDERRKPRRAAGRAHFGAAG